MKFVIGFNIIAIFWLSAPAWRTFLADAARMPRKAVVTGFLAFLAIHSAIMVAERPSLPSHGPSYCGTVEFSYASTSDSPMRWMLDRSSIPTLYVSWIRSHVGYDWAGTVFYLIYGGIQWASLGSVTMLAYALFVKRRTSWATSLPGYGGASGAAS